MPSVLVPLADGFEEIEALAPIDLLRRAGVEVTTASLAETRHATGRSGITIHADATLESVRGQLFDLLFIPGGAGVKALRADQRVGELVRAHAEADRWLAAICAGPTVLHDQGLLHGRQFTAHFSVATELPQAQLEQRVIVDGRLLTSRGAGTAVEFGLQLVAVLTSAEKAKEISKAICL